MAVVVVGGQSRKVGKTSMVAGLIAALPEFHWTAMKITHHEHGGRLAASTRSWALAEETNRSGKSDTARFLAAGAVHSWLVQTQPGRLGEAMSAIQQKLDEAECAIIESNSILPFLQPDLYLLVLDSNEKDFKDSAREFVGCADAVILRESKPGAPEWEGTSLAAFSQRPIFRVAPPEYLTPEIVKFVKARLRK